LSGVKKASLRFRLADREMKTESDRPSKSVADFHSKLGEIYVPITVAAVPAGLFALLGFITRGLDKPGAEPPSSVIVAMITVQTLGTIAMALVFLMRLDLGRRNLMIYTDGHPQVWRKLTLMFSFACLLMFDVATNLSAGIAGAGFLLVASVPVFFVYLVCNRLAFAGLLPSPPQQHSNS
jgi:hypothetical protein